MALGSRPGLSVRPPTGNYYIYLSEDFRMGSFGHPREESLCLWCPDFLDAASAEVDTFLGQPIRRSGRAVGTA
ncbi:DUF2716 domain-containing protein [Streptomyces niveus]|uniref:DUF2716 domain-containing protein n=1 Tax=Streptomyces niveus TaxID=193462 RepID=UPI002E33DC12|nr:DUF2716 domain-containing protein [Streptomyces niveus]